MYIIVIFILCFLIAKILKAKKEEIVKHKQVFLNELDKIIEQEQKAKSLLEKQLINIQAENTSLKGQVKHYSQMSFKNSENIAAKILLEHQLSKIQYDNTSLKEQVEKYKKSHYDMQVQVEKYRKMYYDSKAQADLYTQMYDDLKEQYLGRLKKMKYQSDELEYFRDKCDNKQLNKTCSGICSDCSRVERGLPCVVI